MATTRNSASSPHGSGSRDGSSTTFVSSRPSTSTFVVTNRLAIGVALLCDSEHGTNYLWVRPASAQVAAHAADDVGLRGSGVLPKERHRGENLTGSTEPALQRIVLD